ncbi:M-phase phosphoprotein 6 [Teleopsis dalmanni]|uniref:M-phase phosphoprotein 6 n=1 Tax=Teleopsis dalmanni TaxID=139649 RepID=UPI0018CEF826|nr:M-phase phosphoprotein 6 [Teleopsis dalmanni]
MAHNKNVTLSKGILSMKFMKQTKVKLEKEAEIAEVQSMYSSDAGYKVLGESKFVFEKSFNVLEDLHEGRLSFNGMNPDLERLMEADEAEKKSKVEHKQPVDVSDVEMASNYESNVDTQPYKNKQKTSKTYSMKKKINKKN